MNPSHMPTRENQPQFAGEVAHLKRAVAQRDRRMRLILAASLVAGLVVGLACWFGQPVQDRDGDHLGLALGLGVLTFFLGGMLGRFLFPRPGAICPQCGCDWHAESENNAQTWLAWQRCPGCGMQMSDDVPQRL
jgi:hypothetical protein